MGKYSESYAAMVAASPVTGKMRGRILRDGPLALLRMRRYLAFLILKSTRRVRLEGLERFTV